MLRRIAFAVLFTFAAHAQLPAVPPLPAEGFPAAAAAEPFARALLAKVPPAKLEAELVRNPDAIPAILRNLGSALMSNDKQLQAKLARYMASVAQANAKRTPPDVRLLVSLTLFDPGRFLHDPEFRARVTPLIAGVFHPGVDANVRLAALRDLNDVIGLDFDTAETIAMSWGSLKKRSSEKRTTFAHDKLRLPDDLSGPIEASIYSINSHFFNAGEARAFVAAVRASAPKRKLVILADAPIAAALNDLNVDVVETFGRFYTPWPRDPFTVARNERGVVLINRPNLQPDREEDVNIVRAVVQGAPFDAQWTTAKTPFHNGHILLTPDAAWISIHTVEIRTLEILGLRKVPVETFTTSDGVAKYLVAVKQAAKELEALYKRPVKFVHALDPDPELMRRLGGGGGFDLDSLLTLLPQPDGTLHALLGDITLGAKLARKADWTEARRAYGISVEMNVATEQARPRTVFLASFLAAIASHLGKQGVVVRKLPLLLIPAEPKDFLLTWNNVVLETRDDERRAEGFASLLANADKAARDVFDDSFYELTLFPPLARSVVLSGGYRCASNHVRP